MIVEYIRYEIHDSARRVTFEGAYREAAAALEASPHCLAYELARCAEDARRYVLRIEWDSAEGHLQGFRRSEQFRRFFACVRAFVGDVTEMRHHEVVRSIAWRREETAV